MRLVVLGLVAVSFLAGCDDEEPVVPSGPVYYYDDIRPILADHCLGCHTEGGIAPFALESYAAAFEVSDRIAEVTRDRVMPPLLAVSDECNEYSNSRALDQAEIDTIGEWVRQGMPEGDASIPEPPRRELDTLDAVSSTLDLGLEYTPRAGVDDDYRCFTVQPDWEGTRYLTGYDVRPGNAEIVHHLIVYQPINSSEGDRAVAMERGDPRPGYTCYGDAVVYALPIVLWAPSAGAALFPEGTGIPVDGGNPLIVQIHYNLLADDGVPDRSLVDLRLEDTVETPASMALLADFGIVLPPRTAEVVTEYEDGLIFGPSGPVRVWGAFPHMHTLGRQLHVEAVNDANTCMVDVPRWDFNWQSAFWYETPIDLGSEQTYRISCTYDTTERDSVTEWGDGTADEMCLSFFYVTPR